MITFFIALAQAVAYPVGILFALICAGIFLVRCYLKPAGIETGSISGC